MDTSPPVRRRWLRLKKQIPNIRRSKLMHLQNRVTHTQHPYLDKTVWARFRSTVHLNQSLSQRLVSYVWLTRTQCPPVWVFLFSRGVKEIESALFRTWRQRFEYAPIDVAKRRLDIVR
jgi:hypothetical protein